MSFSQLRTQISTDLGRIDSVQEYKKVYLSKEVIRSIENLNKKFVEHLFKDLINRDPEFNIRSFLSDKEKYQTANEFARDCIEPAFYKSNIYGSKIKSWTNSALKCFDVFLIKFINDYLNEKIKKHGSKLKERDVYTHLMNKGGNYSQIGVKFQTIYQKRNEFTHIQYETKDGYRAVKKWSKSSYDRARDIILSEFEKGLKYFLDEIRKHDF